MGRGHVNHIVRRDGVELVAVCDVDRVRRDGGVKQVDAVYAARRAGGTHTGCASINDYREVLDRPDVDAVVIATPDHLHSLISVEAARAGKDVYCEKPVSLTLTEGRELVKAVRRYGRVFQTGTQYRSISTIRRVCQFVREGGLGKVKATFTVWRKTNVPTVGPSYVPLDPVLGEEPVPEGLDWNRWVGPAMYRPYNRLYHRNPMPGVVPWVFCNAFGGGAVTSYHSHAADVIQYALGMETSGPVEIFHPGDGPYPTLTCRYANGVLLHHVQNWNQVKTLYHAVPAGARLAGMFGGLFVGERGWITANSAGGPIEGGPEKIFRDLDLPTREVNTGDNDHHDNWLRCIRTRGRPSSHEEIGHRSASLGHLVALSYQLGRSLTWDPEQEFFPDDETANRLRARAMRAPYQI
jgi:predicted dehydrogenase